MLGQTGVIAKLKATKARSVLLTGPAHHGKKTLLRELFSGEEAVYEIVGNAATFRDALDKIYLNARPTVYIIPDVDRCNQTVQNLLLKMLEEPPLKARFFLTASGSVLPTITSRCVTYRMEPYSNSVLGHLSSAACLIGLFRSPGELQIMNTPNIQAIGEQMKSIRDNINSQSLAKTLLSVKDLEKLMADDGLIQDAFILLAQAVYGACESVNWLRSQPNDNVRYVRKAFYMNFWKERQVSSK